MFDSWQGVPWYKVAFAVIMGLVFVGVPAFFLVVLLVGILKQLAQLLWQLPISLGRRLLRRQAVSLSRARQVMPALAASNPRQQTSSPARRRSEAVDALVPDLSDWIRRQKAKEPELTLSATYYEGVFGAMAALPVLPYAVAPDETWSTSMPATNAVAHVTSFVAQAALQGRRVSIEPAAAGLLILRAGMNEWQVRRTGPNEFQTWWKA